MSVDVLQDKIRKKKNPAMLLLGCDPQELPPQYAAGTLAGGFFSCYSELLENLKDLIPAVRLSYSDFSLLGPEGLEVLPRLLKLAANLGYYVVLDAPQMLTPESAKRCAALLLEEDSPYVFDGLLIPCYLGSDIMKPFLTGCKKQRKELFVVTRTGNRSASELQDLLTGSRLVHMAAADHVNRYVDTPGKHGFSSVGSLAGASSAESLRLLRSSYPKLFMLLDGFDYPNANARNCSFAFDQFGHGAIACSGSGITGAWLKEGKGEAFLEEARAAAERMKKNLNRYLNIL